MSNWSRTVKPAADTTIPAEEIFGVDGNEIAATPGPQHAGWVRRRTVGSRVLYETLVAMSTPPDEDNADDTQFPDELITISVQPASKTVLSDTATTFAVTATTLLSSPITYLWQVSTNGGTSWSNATGGVYSGDTTATLAISDTTGLGTYQYRCQLQVTDKTGVLNSSAATLTVTVPVITIGTQPVNTTVTAPASVAFSVAASSTPTVTLSYLWQVSTDSGSTWGAASGGVYSGGTTATLSISNSTGLNTYQYRCQVSGTNDAVTQTSTAATLTVNP